MYVCVVCFYLSIDLFISLHFKDCISISLYLYNDNKDILSCIILSYRLWLMLLIMVIFFVVFFFYFLKNIFTWISDVTQLFPRAVTTARGPTDKSAMCKLNNICKVIMLTWNDKVTSTIYIYSWTWESCESILGFILTFCQNKKGWFSILFGLPNTQDNVKVQGA